MPETEIITFGCRLNAFESEVIRRAAATAGLSDAVIINTCAVTAEAERQARPAIRRARRAPRDLLHHPLCAGPQPIGGDGPCRRSGTPARRFRLSRDRADRRRSDGLWRRPARHARSRPAGAPVARRGAGARTSAAFVTR